MEEDPKHVATLPPRSPGSMTLAKKPHPGCPAIAMATQTNIWHPSEVRLEARGPERGEQIPAGTQLCPRLLRWRKDRSESGHQYPCYLPGTPVPEVQGLLQYEALSCTYIGRSKVIVKAAAGRRCSPELWKLPSAFCPAQTRISSSSSSSSMKENSLSGCLGAAARALSGPRKAGLRSSRTPEVQLDRELLSRVV